eukprot:TRINITY_DN4631_c0_g2_i1.p1 TRINITY_DN4631_c0_g2~~TRINITY_DN4631_c0_g2_i1.p1  ORF type:complete len:630 (+),score=165.25 TRINITY_DN4631_c0_g2_i1:231-2120(+)
MAGGSQALTLDDEPSLCSLKGRLFSVLTDKAEQGELDTVVERALLGMEEDAWVHDIVPHTPGVLDKMGALGGGSNGTSSVMAAHQEQDESIHSLRSRLCNVLVDGATSGSLDAAIERSLLLPLPLVEEEPILEEEEAIDSLKGRFFGALVDGATSGSLEAAIDDMVHEAALEAIAPPEESTAEDIGVLKNRLLDRLVTKATVGELDRMVEDLLEEEEAAVAAATANSGPEGDSSEPIDQLRGRLFSTLIETSNNGALDQAIEQALEESTEPVEQLRNRLFSCLTEHAGDGTLDDIISKAVMDDVPEEPVPSPPPEDVPPVPSPPDGADLPEDAALPVTSKPLSAAGDPGSSGSCCGGHGAERQMSKSRSKYSVVSAFKVYAHHEQNDATLEGLKGILLDCFLEEAAAGVLQGHVQKALDVSGGSGSNMALADEPEPVQEPEPGSSPNRCDSPEKPGRLSQGPAPGPADAVGVKGQRQMETPRHHLVPEAPTSPKPPGSSRPVSRGQVYSAPALQRAQQIIVSRTSRLEQLRALLLQTEQRLSRKCEQEAEMLEKLRRAREEEQRALADQTALAKAVLEADRRKLELERSIKEETVKLTPGLPRVWALDTRSEHQSWMTTGTVAGTWADS